MRTSGSAVSACSGAGVDRAPLVRLRGIPSPVPAPGPERVTAERAPASANLRGIDLMVLAMFGFAVTDMFIKRLGGALPTGQIVATLGLGGSLLFALLARRRGEALVTRAFLEPAVLLRNGAEIAGTLMFVGAVVHSPLSVTSAIIQTTPLAVTLGAALWLRERVGAARWCAIGVGLVGVLLVIQPWREAFEPASLLAVGAAVALALRDLATRGVPPGIPSTVLSSYALALLVPAGLALLALPIGPPAAWPDPGQAMTLLAAIAISTLGYFGVTAGMRVGEVSVVTPFRYTRIVFALVIAVAVFDEKIDALMLAGATIVVGSGLWSLVHERRLERRGRADRLPSSAPPRRSRPLDAPRVVSLHRYPIKGMSAESLERVSLSAGRGFPHDRAWGFARHGTDFDPARPKPLPKKRFLMLARDERLAALDARFDPETLTLAIEEAGEEVFRADMGTEHGREAAGAFLARALELGDDRPPRFVSAGEHRFTDVSVVSETMMHAVSLVNLASLRELAKRVGRAIEPERFRANIVVDGLEPWSELELVGREIEIAGVRMRALLRTQRCAATEVSPATATRDLRVPRLIAEHFGHPDMGVYLEVLGEGTLAPGDAVRAGA